MNVEKVRKYIGRVNSIEAEFLCMDFTSQEMESILAKADFVYMDPPYLVGDAVYNATWDSEKEYALLDFIDSLVEKKINFALSNVLSKVGKTNEPLSYWCHKNKQHIEVTDIEYNYKSASYNKIVRNAKEREVVITNKGYNNED